MHDAARAILTCLLTWVLCMSCTVQICLVLYVQHDAEHAPTSDGGRTPCSCQRRDLSCTAGLILGYS